MQPFEITLWGTIPILLFFFIVLALFWLFDRRLLSAFLNSCGHALSSVRCMRIDWHLAVAVVGGAIFSVAVVGALLMLCLPLKLLLPAVAVLALTVCETLGSSVRAYMRSFNNTQAHRYYLLANGASFIESLIPSLRRALRACVVPQARRIGLPLALKTAMLFLGMLMGGMTATMAVAVTLLVCAASFVAMVTATLATAFLLKKLNICS